MSFIKSNYKILVVALLAFLIVGGVLYYNFVLTPQLETLEGLRYENQIKYEELQNLGKEFQALGTRKKELRDIEMQTRSLEEQVPAYDTSVLLMAEVIQYTQIYNYGERSVEVGTPLVKEEPNKPYETVPVTIRYTTSYENTVKFLEMLNRSYHMITIDSYSIDNVIQEKNDEENTMPVTKDTVETELVLLMHYKETGDSETYPNFMAYLENEENIFERPMADEELDKQDTESKRETERATERETEASKPDSQAGVVTRTSFNIHLADILRSGDNYSFSSYNPSEDPVYVGLTSSKNTKIELIIRDNSYTCLIEDSEGNKNEKRVDTRVENPSINITSQIQNVMEIMPTASIYIRNYTPGVININLRGTSLENVLIYNENNKLVEPGTQSGKIAVTR